jgi:hypothetical protein
MKGFEKKNKRWKIIAHFLYRVGAYSGVWFTTINATME